VTSAILVQHPDDGLNARLNLRDCTFETLLPFFQTPMPVL
jgi:hypothetical protein